MEERNGGVDEERVTGDETADNPVGELVKEAAGNNGEQLRAPVEEYFEQNGDEPEHQSGQEERPGLILFRTSRCPAHHTLFLLSLYSKSMIKG